MIFMYMNLSYPAMSLPDPSGYLLVSHSTPLKSSFLMSICIVPYSAIDLPESTYHIRCMSSVAQFLGVSVGGLRGRRARMDLKFTLTNLLGY